MGKESCSRIKDGNGWLAMGDEVRRIILGIFILYRHIATCVALIVFREVTTLEAGMEWESSEGEGREKWVKNE